MKTKLKTIKYKDEEYTILALCCPGCSAMNNGSAGFHLIPVNSPNHTPSWNWNGSYDKPTLSPSIMSKNGAGGVCHSFLEDGVFRFLDDSTHALVGKEVEIPDLPKWAARG